MSSLEKCVYRFGGFELEPGERRLSGAGGPVALTPKVFDTLVLLVERAGHVVSKDELMRALWPRGYVDESNLTKHIWLIRRSLGDGENDSRYIETVPKLGYRFVAPVTISDAAAPASSATAAGPVVPPPALASPAPVAAPAATSGAGSRWASGQQTPGRRSRFWLSTAVLATVLLAIAVAWQVTKRRAIPPSTGRPGHAVAFVGFSNLSRNDKDAWLSGALTEMLGAELSVADDLQVVPDELVRNASSDLSPPAAGGYAPETLARLRQRLNADYVISGSYLVSGSSDDAPLRVDIALQDARTGSLVASVSNQGGIAGLLALVTRSGTALRARLGIRPPDAGALDLVAAAQPPSVDVARRIGFALDALRHYDAARARDELLEAIAEAPGYAPAYSLLAQAWTALGYRDKALAAAEQAVRNSSSLPQEQRLHAEAVVESARSEWGKAAIAWHALAQLKPQNPEYRLRLIDAQVAAAAADSAQATLRALQQLPNAAGDPRVELAASRVASALDDAKGSAQHASLALGQARQRDAAGLIADAQVALAGALMHLGQNDQARTSLTEAIAGYRLIRNPRGEAAARDDLATALANVRRNQDAREEYQRALAIYRSVGDVGGIARVYRDICSMLWVAGDRDAAQAAARHSLELARETSDLYLQAWTLRALATIASDEAASDEVVNEYHEIIALNVRTGDRGGHVWSLASYADVERLRGNLKEARASCAQARAEAAALSDPQFAIYSAFTCSLVDVDEGREGPARAALDDVVRRVGDTGDTTYRDNALMTLAQLDMDVGRWGAARDLLRRAADGFAAGEVQTGEADAQAMLAVCEQALGQDVERDRAADRARTLRQGITARQEVYGVDITLELLEGRTHAQSAAPDKLLALAADAERRQWLAWSLEAKLMAWELLRTRDAGAAGALRAQLEKTAQAHGFGRVLKLVQQPRGASV